MLHSIDPMIIKKPWFWVAWFLGICLLSAWAFAAHNVATPYQLWNIRNDLTDTFTQTANIDLAISNPATKPAAYAGGTTYQVGDSVTHTHGATEKTYFSLVADNLGSDPTDADTANWAIAWVTTAGWNPVGLTGTPFTGTFTGTGFTISNLFINRPTASNIGLFGSVNHADGTMTNITVTGANVTALGNVGAVIGGAYCVISGCSSTGSVTSPAGGSYTGGLIGYTYAGSVTSCYSTCTVSGVTNVGGLVGRVDAGTSFVTCYATGAVTGTDYTGGLVGYSTGAITSCYATTGAVSGTSYVGGLVGNSTAAITGCYSTRAVTGSSSEVGGLIGKSSAALTSCYATGAVAGSGSDVGGLAGWTTITSPVTQCYATGTVTSSAGNCLGGLIGISEGTISACYSTGAVTGTGTNGFTGGFVGRFNQLSYVISNCYSKGTVSCGSGGTFGGFVGYASNGTLLNCYATGLVTGAAGKGFCGALGAGGTSTLCYWDTTTSGQATSSGGTGFATASMIYNYAALSPQPPSNAAGPYYGWVFPTVWKHDYQTYFGQAVNGGYPVFQWQYPDYVLIKQ